ncbi:gamma carbonic anhydrase family protein [Helicobacter sp. 11S03491-1]|uniref:gamma carbonic anhydrase family protein n=1 Tax=Helicobacter sp. 11S03491-1 TaxID=1476196 RepID=UPI000BA66BF8|nr:gamma carbonic anhydrase family protein [Helicobacter sp. 11S03491-1]PAF43908.1 gamma carbonic anhydrase family protein [Helicobacter sp. 11S03491-1]
MKGNIIGFNQNTPQIHASAIVFEGVQIIGNVSVEQECSLWFGCVLRGDVNSIKIGAGSNIQDLSIIHVAYENEHGGGVEIGEDVTIGHNCVIHACTIKNLCLIGMGSIIMDDACIGEMSIVGAGSLVTKGKVFPPKSLILGNPAKLIRVLNENEIQSIQVSANEYVKLAKAYQKNSL